jgi:hypothetical protein
MAIYIYFLKNQALLRSLDIHNLLTYLEINAIVISKCPEFGVPEVPEDGSDESHTSY